MQKRQTQFSKKIVVFVSLSVTLICVASIILMWSVSSVQYMADIIKSYITFAMIVFASYSGNSIAQKFILHNNMGRIFDSPSSSSASQRAEEEDSNG